MMRNHSPARLPSGSSLFLLSLWCVLGILLQLGIAPNVEARPDGFSVVGWVKSRFSSDEPARPEPNLAVSTPQVHDLAAAQAVYSSTAPVSSRSPSRSAALPPPRLLPPPRSPQPLPQGALPAASTNRSFSGKPSVDELRRRAEFLSTQGLAYKFGGDHPSEGGMDCSGTMQFLLKSMGFPDIPRTSYAQFEWLKHQGNLKKIGFFHSRERAIRNFQPGDLIFWGGTYNSGHRVSHVMVYLGRGQNGTHFVFGARGKKVKGMNGNGVDIFEFKPQSTGGRLVGYGPLPGLIGR